MNSLDLLFDFVALTANPPTANLQPLHPDPSDPRPLDLRIAAAHSTQSIPRQPPLIHHHHYQPTTHTPPHPTNHTSHLPPNENDLIVFSTSDHTPSQIPIEWLPTPHNAHWHDGLVAPPHPLPCGHLPDQLCCCYTPLITDDYSFNWPEALVWGEQVPHLQLRPQMEYHDGYSGGRGGFGGEMGQVVCYMDPDPDRAPGYGGGGCCAPSSVGSLETMRGERGGLFVLRSNGTPELETRGMRR